MISWPNRITILRILLIPLLVMAAIRGDEAPRYRIWTLVIFLGLALTDAVDGFLARVLKQKTPLGSFLDPLADKLLLTTATVLLICPIWIDPANPSSGDLVRLLPASIGVIVISRDLLLALGTLSSFVLTGNLSIRPSILGKLTTGAQVAMIVSALAPWPRWLSPAIAWMAVGFTSASFVGYTWDWSRQMALFAEPEKK